MAEDKVFKKGMMNEEELDNVVGGAGYVYYTKGTKNGQSGYYAMRCRTRFTTQAQVLAKYNEPNATEEVIETVTGPDGMIRHNATTLRVAKMFIPDADVAAFVERCKTTSTTLIDLSSLPK